MASSYCKVMVSSFKPLLPPVTMPARSERLGAFFLELPAQPGMYASARHTVVMMTHLKNGVLMSARVRKRLSHIRNGSEYNMKLSYIVSAKKLLIATVQERAR